MNAGVTMATAAEVLEKTYKPGDIVEASGIYRVTHDPVHTEPHEPSLWKSAFRRVGAARAHDSRPCGSRITLRTTSTSSSDLDSQRAVGSFPVDDPFGVLPEPLRKELALFHAGWTANATLEYIYRGFVAWAELNEYCVPLYRESLDKYAEADETQLDLRYADVRKAHREDLQKIHDGYVAGATAMRSAIAHIDRLRARS